MKNGTSKAVLVTDLFRSDGPFQTIAEDFLTQRCSFCGHAVDNEARFTTDGYRCSFCAAAYAAGVR